MLIYIILYLFVLLALCFLIILYSFFLRMRHEGKEPGEEEDTEDVDAKNALDLAIPHNPNPRIRQPKVELLRDILPRSCSCTEDHATLKCEGRFIILGCKLSFPNTLHFIFVSFYYVSCRYLQYFLLLHCTFFSYIYIHLSSSIVIALCIFAWYIFQRQKL